MTEGCTVLSRFVAQVARSPRNNAMVFGDREYTYADLNELSCALCDLMESAGVKKGARVGVLTENNVYTYASILATLSCGACYVPLNPDNPFATNTNIVDDAAIEVILHAEEGLKASELAVAAGNRCRTLDTRVSPASDRTLEPAALLPDDLCYLLFTSGTTGKPKGVPIHHRNLAAFLDAVLESGRYSFTSDDRFLQMFELTFDLSVFSFLVPLSVGASVHMLPKQAPTYLEVVIALEAHEISVALMVPSVINYLKPYFGEISCPKLRYSLFCGEALYHETLSRWAACVPSAKIENLYGPTEATIFCLRHEWTSDDIAAPDAKGIVPIGTPIEGMDAFLLDDHGATNEEGELCLTGDQVTSGYWNNATKTAQAFGRTDAGAVFYRTGDLCRRDASGNFLFLGRIDNQVKIDGHRVELEEIEFHARAFCDDRPVAATTEASETGSLFVVLFVEGGDGVKPGLHDYLKNRLPAYMVPKDVIAVSEFPRTKNGKTDRKALTSTYLVRSHATTSRVATT